MTTLEPSRPSVSSICERHPDQPVTGFCADCLRERLAGLDQLQEPRRKSTSSAISGNPLRAIFRAAGEPSRPSNVSSKPSSSSAASSFLPELRRCKSFSAPRAEGFFSGLFEPQRKSCDVRGRSTLYSLFHQADETAAGEVVDPRRTSNSETTLSAAAAAVAGFEIEEAADEEFEEVEEQLRRREEEVVVEAETKTMKDHIDTEAARKTEKEKKDIAGGGFWGAASVFSKKLQSWRRKQKEKKATRKSSTAASVAGDAAAGKASSFSRRFRDTQSEVADYGFGRRSCDTDPRFSLDAGRISLDDPRFSFDEPRASWDGYLVGAGRREGPRFPIMLSVIEDPPLPAVPRSDAEIPVEMEHFEAGEESSEPPGGTTQTREYYSDSSSSSRRKKSLDRLGSVKKASEIDETKPVYLNAKVAPASSDHNYAPGNKFSAGGFSGGLGESKHSSFNDLHDYCWQSFDSRDGAGAGGKNTGAGGGGGKKSRRWGMAWSIWGLIHRRSKEDDDEKSIQTSSVIDRSFSESWPDLRRETNPDLRGGIDRRVFRCNSSVSSRGTSWAGNGYGGPPAPAMPPPASWRRRKEEPPALERNRSARYSPGHFDNGLLRFYLTPLRGSRKNGFGAAGKIVPKRGGIRRSFTRSMFNLY